ncbi:hypothetical protein [Streptomyces sp. N2A]|uniref:hypothetical protein n=1 Tax=Streptomyces sp. N2A TaxID=3073936 RepID=UPI00287089C5|nr:hypothetical protein [Streptomyces sp. N2A]
MPTLAWLVILLLTLVCLLFSGALIYVAHRYPQLVQPIMVGLAGLTLLTAVLGIIATH